MDKITKDKIVEIEYSLYDSEGNFIEASESFKYLHGHKNIIRARVNKVILKF